MRLKDFLSKKEIEHWKKVFDKMKAEGELFYYESEENGGSG